LEDAAAQFLWGGSNSVDRTDDGVHQMVHIERTAIMCALRRTGVNKAKAARLLQVDYKTLHTKVKEYGIQFEGAKA